jgi:hypothetical protein
MEVKFTGKPLESKDSIGSLVRITAEQLEKAGVGNVYNVVAHSRNKSRITTAKGEWVLVHCTIGGKGLVSYLSNIDDCPLEGEELVLEFTEVVDGRARFNVIGELAKS